ncbi:hypothetical protein HAX54_021594 [Datura stramonium]|uniref:Uncharacterized protein n=1 Tax=Datura stramonium TaxID=4076 RepID=A0ABS8UVF0_DATST|nr:hypothetical protein [Datura stramonium]
MEDLNTLINLGMKLLTSKRKCRRLELRDQPQPTKLGLLLSNKLPLFSLIRETNLQKLDLVRMALGPTQMRKVEMMPQYAQQGKLSPQRVMSLNPKHVDSRRVCGLTFDISSITINRLRYRSAFALPVGTTKLDYRMREWYNQRPWLAQVLTDVVRLRMFPIGGDNILGEDRAVMVASLMSWFPLNIRHIIADEMRAWAIKFSTSLPFSFLVTRAIAAVLVPYESLHSWIDYMEAGANERLKDLIVPNIAKFAIELAKTQANIL